MTPDFVIVGAGFFGCVCAERLASAGHNILILEKRNHIGGNCWSELDPDTGIEVHKYGSHIFHTPNQKVMNYLSRFTSLNEYRHTVWTTFKNQVYSLPINLGTINSYYGLNLKPFEVEIFLEKERGKERYDNPQNLEEQAIALIGRPLYEAFIRGYTIKQWGKDPKELAAEIITRLPVRNNYNNRYFNDTFEGIPIDGYGALFHKLLQHPNIQVQLNTDWFHVRDQVYGNAPVIYTGPIDQFFDYKHGRLEWRSIHFERQLHEVADYQGCSVMNYADPQIPYTRIHEFKHYHPERLKSEKTVIYKEYSKIVSETTEPYYPVNTPRNARLLNVYKQESADLKNIWFGGRLGDYCYYDMDDTVEAALILVDKLL